MKELVSAARVSCEEMAGAGFPDEVGATGKSRVSGL